MRVPLSIWDKLGLRFDFTDDPNTIFCEFQASGALDKPRLEKSWREIQKRTPLLNSKLIKESKNFLTHMYWGECSSDSPITWLQYEDSQELESHRNHISSKQVDPVRGLCELFVAIGKDGFSLLLLAHHAAFDGISCVAVLKSLCESYSGDPNWDESLFHIANNLKVEHQQDKRGDSNHKGKKNRSFEYLPFFHKVTRIHRTVTTNRPGYSVLNRSLSQSEFEIVTTRRKTYNATVNDLLLLAFNRAIDMWNASNKTETNLTLITMPINLRPGRSRYMGIGNFTAAVPIGSNLNDRVNSKQLLSAITAQTSSFKATPASPIFNLINEILSRPPLVNLILAVYNPLGNKYVHSAILSNLGHLQELIPVGTSSKVNHILFSTAGRMPRGVAIGAIGYDSSIDLTLRYRNAQFEKGDGEMFLDLFVDALVT
ncbi:MAG: hypothetical protein HKL80_07870 [Acidimicrobiales bacterium]|nr:hypothetical protein [Acidimicrobiales bacterium]